MIKSIRDFLFRQIAIVAWKVRVISRTLAKHNEQTMPEFDILPFTGGGSTPVQYNLDYEGHSYYIRYRSGWVSVTRDFCFENEAEVLEQQLSNNEYHGSWSDEETTVYLALISESIRQADFEQLRLPTIEETALHPFYRKGPLPLHEVGLICGQSTPVNAPPQGNMNRHERKRRRQAGIHDHTNECIKYVPACEVKQWIAQQPQEYVALLSERRKW